ncbi:sensor histidine kinase ResE [Clostridium aceticum]|uniref:histidine kinase n=1 Tax=Clostridium aceticum TaxID=84022 RepID=A0A0D8IEV0_9CLOT|nr:ATP-binding protein [Clostridium aceticum]AKL94145.1 sensor histidine kinase ResE [Clostridium aceticum]KJF28507.1 hypothetical protein TZ02_00850 [Clostridium aceticum]
MNSRLWGDFVRKGILSLEIEEEISKSWKASKVCNVSCEAPYEEQEMSSSALEKLLHLHRYKLATIKKHLDRLNKGFKENTHKTNYGVLLLSKQGYLLHSINTFSEEEETLLGLKIGTNWGIDVKGTTAIGLALTDNKAVVVNNCQHYQERYHPYITEAIPIQNSQRELLYILGMVSSSCEHSKLLSTLGNITAKSIENEIIAMKYKDEIKELKEKSIKQNKLYETQTNLLNYILNHTKEMIFIMNEKGKYVLLNKASWKFMKENQVYSLEDIYKKLQVCDLEGKRKTSKEDPTLSVFTENPIYRCRAMIKKLQGEERYYNIHSIPYCDHHDRRLAIAIIEDVTDYIELQEMKNSFEHKAEQLETVINTISDGIAILSPEGDYIMMNPACLKMLPCLEMEQQDHCNIHDEAAKEKSCSVIDKKSFEILPCLKAKGQNHRKKFGEVVEEKICNICTIDKNGSAIEVEDYPLVEVLAGKKIKNQTFVINKNNKMTYIRLSGSPVFDAAGKLSYAVIGINDITKTTKQEIKIKQQKEFMNSVMDSISIPIAVVSYPSGVYEYLNSKQLEIFSEVIGKMLTYKQVIGKTTYEILPPEYLHCIEEQKETDVVATEKMVSVQLAKGGTRHYQVVCTTLSNKVDEKKQIVVVGMDVTPQVKLQEETELLTKSKEDYFATISHELRSPIAIIHSAVQMFKSEHYAKQFNDGTRKLISRVEKNTYRLLRLVNNFLDITRAEAGFMKLNLTNTNIVTYTDFIVESILPIGEKKGIKIDFLYDCNTKTISLDIEKYERILLNLLSNAFKFTEENGRIQVYIKEEEKYMKVGVKDTGIGIPQEEIDKIFDRFYISENINKRENGGTGIGLSLVKKLMEFMGGKVEVHSKEGAGSEFILLFPKHIEEENLSNEKEIQLTESAYLELENIP